MTNSPNLESPSAGVLVDALVEVRRAESRLAARKARLIDALRQDNLANQERLAWGEESPRKLTEFVERSTRAEVARALRVHEVVATGLIAESTALCDALPMTLAAMAAGELSSRQASVVVAGHWALPADAVPAFDQAAMGGRLDVAQSVFKRRIRALRDRMLPTSIDDRARDAVRERRVTLDHMADGMSMLSAYLPTLEAVAVYDALGGAALDVQDRGDDRTRAQLRADILMEAVLRGGDISDPACTTDTIRSLRGVTPEVSVTIPVLALLGLTDEPATLDGVGPIPIDVARTLAGMAKSWCRILTHPVTGTVLSYDRQTYRVPADLKRWVKKRDRICRFPGCTRPARESDVDHIVAWADGGMTDADNLHDLCKMHHRLKHHTGWEPVMHAEGMETWTDPTGHEHETAPDDNWVLPVDPVPPDILEMVRVAMDRQYELERMGVRSDG